MADSSGIRSGLPPNQLLTLGDLQVSGVIEESARRFGVASRDLRPRVRLHLPRIADAAGRVKVAQLMSEIRRCVDLLRSDYDEIESLIPRAHVSLEQLEFRKLEPIAAEAVFSRLHYLRSARPDAENFGLVDREHGLALCLCSVATVDWLKLATRLSRVASDRIALGPDAMRDVARVYSFEVAPANSISRLLSQVRSSLRKDKPTIRLLTTVVDPNLGFDGASYRAASWRHWMTVRPRPYFYVDDCYASPRKLRELYGTSHPLELREKLGPRFRTSRTRLKDSLVFCSRTRGETEYGSPGQAGPMHR